MATREQLAGLVFITTGDHVLANASDNHALADDLDVLSAQVLDAASTLDAASQDHALAQAISMQERVAQLRTTATNMDAAARGPRHNT